MDTPRAQLVARLQSLNNVRLERDTSYLPLVCGGAAVGLVAPEVAAQLRRYPEQLTVARDRVTLAPAADTSVAARTAALALVMADLRDRGVFPAALAGWRAEGYDIRNRFSEAALFRLERAASPLLGVRKYGVQITGWVRHSSLGTCVWLQQRAASKPTWPGMMDNFVGGGVTEGLGVAETAVKEAAEEAGVEAALASQLVAAGSVSFLHRTERGLHPNTEFVFDLELPEDWAPRNTDGEVCGWELVPAATLLEVACSDRFKITSVPVVVDWLTRHGLLAPDPELEAMLRVPLDTLYDYFNPPR